MNDNDIKYGEAIDSGVIDALIIGKDCGENCSVMGSQRYVGFKDNNCDFQKYFSNDTIRMISNKLTDLLMGVAPNNRPIIIPDKTICSVMDTIYQSFRPRTGDIFTRYNIANGSTTPSYVQQLIDQTIEVIYSDVRNNLGMEENNKKLSVWTTLLGEFNEHQLRSHPPIKIKQRRPNPFEFHMNY